MQFLQFFLAIFSNKILAGHIMQIFAVFCISIYLSGCMVSGQNIKKTNQLSDNKNIKTSVGLSSPIDSLKELNPNFKPKTTLLFAEKLNTTEERVDRLENAVQKIKEDFDVMAPSVVRLVAIEKDIKKLVKQLEDVVYEENKNLKVTTPTWSGADILPSNTKSTSKIASVKNKKLDKNIIISGMRVEENINTTRLVLDISSKVNVDTSFSNKNKELALIISNAIWEGEEYWESEFSPLISSYRVDGVGNNKIIKVSLNFPAKLIKQDTVPIKQGQGYQIILDLQSDVIHF